MDTPCKNIPTYPWNIWNTLLTRKQQFDEVHAFEGLGRPVGIGWSKEQGSLRLQWAKFGQFNWGNPYLKPYTTFNFPWNNLKKRIRWNWFLCWTDIHTLAPSNFFGGDSKKMIKPDNPPSQVWKESRYSLLVLSQGWGVSSKGVLKGLFWCLYVQFQYIIP